MYNQFLAPGNEKTLPKCKDRPFLLFLFCGPELSLISFFRFFFFFFRFFVFFFLSSYFFFLVVVVPEVKGHVKPILRGMITIAGGLRQDKELRDIFLDLAEKVVSLCKKASLTHEESGRENPSLILPHLFSRVNLSFPLISIIFFLFSYFRAHVFPDSRLQGPQINSRGR